MKLINAGKILENNKTVCQCKAPFGELPNGVITMHAVVQPSLAKVKTDDSCSMSLSLSHATEKKIDEAPKKNVCSCTVL
ncbi:hypothetical protein Leryth_009299 [Lithospermum erythrorhizon]|nr:hypothetical protein Leryth_009299 [Lithospermum erythrorhizon]